MVREDINLGLGNFKGDLDGKRWIY